MKCLNCKNETYSDDPAIVEKFCDSCLWLKGRGYIDKEIIEKKLRLCDCCQEDIANKDNKYCTMCEDNKLE